MEDSAQIKMSVQATMSAIPKKQSVKILTEAIHVPAGQDTLEMVFNVSMSTNV